MKTIFIFVLMLILISLNTPSFAGTLTQDFNNGKADGWERSPQNEKNNSVFWGVANGAFMFDPKGNPWDQAISQMNFVGDKRVTNVRDWTDYEFQVDIKHAEIANWPGGIRARVDLDTGGHYVAWLYPGDSNIKLYKNPGWNINDGIKELGAGQYKPEANKFHNLKISCTGETIEVFYDGEKKITAKDNEHKKGTIALCVQDKVVYYDNIKVTGNNIPNANMSPVDSNGKLTSTWGKIRSEY